MVTATPEAIQAWEETRRACLRMPEGYAQRGGPGRVFVFGVRRLRPDARFGQRQLPMREVISTHFFAPLDHLHGDAAIDLRMAVVQDSGTQLGPDQMTSVARKVTAS
jgi:hypothetical protein